MWFLMYVVYTLSTKKKICTFVTSYFPVATGTLSCRSVARDPRSPCHPSEAVVFRKCFVLRYVSMTGTADHINAFAGRTRSEGALKTPSSLTQGHVGRRVCHPRRKDPHVRQYPDHILRCATTQELSKLVPSNHAKWHHLTSCRTSSRLANR